MKATRLASCISAAFLFAASATASDNAALVQLARKHQGLSAGELQDQSLFEKEFVVRMRVPGFELEHAVYEESRKELAIRPMFFMGGLHKFHEACNETGSGSGRTAGGAHVSYTKEACDQYFLRDYAEFEPGDRDCEALPSGRFLCRPGPIRIPASPSEIRTYMKDGLDVELHIKLKRPSSKPVVEYSVGERPATFERPVEASSRNWTIAAEVSRVTWFAPGRSYSLRTDAQSQRDGPLR
jgi:hypothetical protein